MGVKNGLAIALNDLRQNASNQYQEVVPIVDENTSIESFTAPLLNYPKLMNEFAENLIQRIVYTKFESKVFRNPLKVLEGDKIPLGYLGQEIFVNPAEGRDFDVDDFAGALKKYESDVKVQYQYINFDKQYPVTIVRQSLKQAFVSWGALEDYISNITNSLYNGYYIDEYRNTKALVTNAYRSNAVQVQVVSNPTTNALIKQFVKLARTYFLNFQTPNSKYNAWAKIGGYGREIVTFTNPEDIVMLVRNDIRSEIDVEALAVAFNMDKTTLMGNILPVDDFSIYDKNQNLVYDGSKILGIICDKSWFRIKEQDLYMDEFRNANNRSVNMYLNAIKMFNYSFFANAIVFATEEPAVTITDMTLSDTEVTVDAGATKQVKITTTPFSANTPNITVNSSASGVATAEISGKTITITGVAAGDNADGEAIITVAAGNVSKTISVTVPQATE
ncbi:Ig-like domain-containing protein [Faecalibacillus faecis]|uniref:Ig-like domain-containing protein n=1 Tax=Faecalibacillus faecis TaxID=1982628 RepID=UPI00386775EE